MAKANGNLKAVLIILGAILVPLLTVGVSWGLLKGDVQRNVEYRARVDANTEAGHKRDLTMERVKKDLAWLTSAAAAQKVDTDNNTVLLEEILVRVTSE